MGLRRGHARHSRPGPAAAWHGAQGLACKKESSIKWGGVSGGEGGCVNLRLVEKEDAIRSEAEKEGAWVLDRVALCVTRPGQQPPGTARKRLCVWQRAETTQIQASE